MRWWTPFTSAYMKPASAAPTVTTVLMIHVVSGLVLEVRGVRSSVPPHHAASYQSDLGSLASRDARRPPSPIKRGVPYATPNAGAPPRRASGHDSVSSWASRCRRGCRSAQCAATGLPRGHARTNQIGRVRLEVENDLFVEGILEAFPARQGLERAQAGENTHRERTLAPLGTESLRPHRRSAHAMVASGCARGTAWTAKGEQRPRAGGQGGFRLPEHEPEASHELQIDGPEPSVGHPSDRGMGAFLAERSGSKPQPRVDIPGDGPSVRLSSCRHRWVSSSCGR